VSLLARLLDQERDTYVLGLLRVAVGVLVVVQGAQRLLDTARRGYFGDFFHLPIVPEALVPSVPVYVALQALAVAGGTLAVLGPHGRTGLLASGLIGLFLLLANRLDYHNNRFALLLLALLTAFTPCDRSFVLVPGRSHTLPEPERTAPTFATVLIRLTVSVVYLSSGAGKLVDPDWRGGQTMLVRYARSLDHLGERLGTVPEPVVALLSSPLFASAASKAAIALELSLAVALWLPRVRPVALYAGVLFHLGIELSARVELFSYVMGAAYLSFVVPELRERCVELDPNTGGGRQVARLLRWFDWLARFRVVTRPAAPLSVLDRSGRRWCGIGALAALARAIPVLFPFWLPLAAVSAIRRGPARGPTRG
jgi:hypothetical protein